MNNEFVAKSNFQADYNRATGQNKSLDVEEALRPTREKYEQLARTKAIQFGYVEKAEATAQEEPGLSRREQFKKQAAEVHIRKGQQPDHKAESKGDEGKPVDQQPSGGHALKEESPQQVKIEQPQSAKEAFKTNLASIRERQQQNPHRPR